MARSGRSSLLKVVPAQARDQQSLAAEIIPDAIELAVAAQTIEVTSSLPRPTGAPSLAGLIEKINREREETAGLDEYLSGLLKQAA